MQQKMSLVSIMKLLRYDMRNGCGREAKKILILAVFVLILCFDFDWHTDMWMNMGAVQTPPSYMDYLLYFFGGMSPYVPNPAVKFIFPVRWVLILFLILFSVLDYTCRDFHSSGLQVLSRSRKRLFWWISKMIWAVSVILIDFIIVFLITGLFVKVNQGEIQFSVTLDYLNRQLGSQYQIKAAPEHMAAWIFGILPLMTVAFALFQQMLTLFIKPVFSFLSLCAVLAVSAYFVSPFLPGNYMMAFRSREILDGGMLLYEGILMAALLCIFTVIVGIQRFKRFDVMQMEK